MLLFYFANLFARVLIITISIFYSQTHSIMVMLKGWNVVVDIPPPVLRTSLRQLIKEIFAVDLNRLIPFIFSEDKKQSRCYLPKLNLATNGLQKQFRATIPNTKSALIHPTLSNPWHCLAWGAADVAKTAVKMSAANNRGEDLERGKRVSVSHLKDPRKIIYYVPCLRWVWSSDSLLKITWDAITRHSCRPRVLFYFYFKTCNNGESLILLNVGV